MCGIVVVIVVLYYGSDNGTVLWYIEGGYVVDGDDKNRLVCHILCIVRTDQRMNIFLSEAISIN